MTPTTHDPRPLLAQMNRTAAADLAKAATVLGNKIDWKPLDKGRSALDQVQECGIICTMSTAILQTQAMPPMDPMMFTTLREQNDTPEKALAFLQSAAEKFAVAVEEFPLDKLNEIIHLPFGGPDGMTKSFAEVMMMTHWNTTYHEGQVNYIETLAAE